MPLILVFLLSGCNRRQKPPKDHTAKSDRIIARADLLLRDIPASRSLEYLDSAYKAFPEAGPGDRWKRFLQKVNYYLYYEIDTLKAARYIDSMQVAIAGQTSRYASHFARTLFTEGDLLLQKRRYNEAFNRYYTGLSFAKENLDACQFCQFTGKLGLVKYRQGRYAEAIPYLQEAIRENKQCQTDSSYFNLVQFPQSNLNSIALCFEKTGQPDSGIYYSKQALALIRERAPKFPVKKAFAEAATGVIYGNLGGLYAKAGNKKLAEEYLKKSIRINDRPGYEMADAVTAELKLVRLYFSQGRLAEVNTLLTEIDQDISRLEAQRRGDNDYRMQWLELGRDYYDKTGQPLQAYAFTRRYDTFRDSLVRVTLGLRGADMEGAFKVNEQKNRLTLLAKDARIKQLTINISIVLSIAALIILTLVVNNLRRSKKQIAEQRRLNQEVDAQNQRMQNTLQDLEQSQAENTQLLRMVTHDLRNPIGAMTMLADLMLETPDRVADDLEMLSVIQTSGQNALQLVTDLLQTHTKDIPITMEPVDLCALLQYCVGLMQPKAAEKEQKITFTGLPLVVPASREKLWRVASNLIANAIKFSPVKSEIAVRLTQQENHALIAVEDHGIGMPPEIKDKLFDIQADTRRRGTHGEESFGMGLTISRQIVEAHGGSIWAESQQGIGSTFFVRLRLTDQG